MKGHAALARVVVGKEVALLRRYLFNTVSDVAMLYVIFAIIFFGGRVAAPEFVGDSLSDLIVGFFLWMMAAVAYQGLSLDLIREAQWGTLEQLYMSPFGIGRVVAVKTAVNVAESFLLGGALLALMMVTTGRYLHLDLLTVVVVGALALSTAAGVGFALGGLALVFKRIENVFQLVQFAFVGFVAAPTDPAVLKLLPLTLGSNLLRLAMGDGVRLWELPAGDLALLAATAVVYLLVGFVVFRYMAGLARRRGVLGHY